MSSSAVTLQCPACGGVFLTLQQGTGGAEICPHCSMSAPRARYRSMESQSSPGARTMLPPRRPEQASGTASQPVPVITAAMTPEAVPAERPTGPTTLPPVRPGFATEPVNPVSPQGYEPAVLPPGPAPVPTAPTPAYPPTPGFIPPAPTAEAQVLSMQLPDTAAAPPPAVCSERVPIPPVPPGEVPLPSRVLRTLPTPTASVPACPPAQTPAASPFAVAAAPAPEPSPAPAHAPSGEAPVVPQPAPQPQYPYQYTSAPAAISSPAQLPVAYPPVPAPPPQVDPAAMSKASPAQLWEAAVLQHHQQAQDVSITPTGRELFPTGAVPTFQPPPPPTGPVTFDPLTPSPATEAAPIPPAPESTLPPALPPGGLTTPRPSGTVLPTARSVPPVAPLHAYGAMPADPSAEPLPPPQIGFVAAEPPAIPAEGFVSPSTSPFSMATATSPVEAPPLPPPPGLSEPVMTPTPDFAAALEQAQAQGSAPMQSFFSSAEPPAGSEVFASTEPPAISGDPPPAFVPGSPTQESTLLTGEATARELHLPQTQHEGGSHAPHHAQDLTLVAAKMVRSGGHAPAPAPVRRNKLVPWIAGLLFGSLALGAGLHFLKDSLPTLLHARSGAAAPTQASNNTAPAPPAITPEVMDADGQAPSKQTALSARAPGTADDAPTLTPAPVSAAPVASTPAPNPLPVPPMPPAPAQEEVRRAMPSNPETLSITREDPLPAIAAKLVFGIDSAATPEERAKWIADPDKYSAAMERLIKLRGGRLNTREVEPLTLPDSGPVHALPSGETVALFHVASPASRGGAIVRLHAQNGNYLIDWPLFAQTYDNAFDRFVATNRAIPGSAEWYTVLCSLVGNPDAKTAAREPHLRLKVRGSLAETGVTEAWVEKNSPAGRYLSEHMTPGHTYLVELQFGASDAGSRRLMVLDCVATRGETSQANANK